MQIKEKHPARAFTVGKKNHITIYDCGEVYLKPNEQVTFTTEQGAQYDVSRKDWGFYATPSLNGRLRDHHLRGVLIKNIETKKYYVFLVEKGHEDQFNKYVDSENLSIVCWMDNDKALEDIEKNVRTKGI